MEQSRTYTIGEAVHALRKTHPDVSHSSLRFLERRGFVRPQRTRGGHRQFREADLERIRTIKDWQDQNLTLEQIGDRLQRLGAMPGFPELRSTFLTSALEGKLHQATALVLQADDLGMSVRDIFGKLLTPVLIEVGDRWAAGELSVGQEHEVSELCRDLISEITMRHMKRPETTFSVLAAAVEGELHDLGLRMISGILRQAGIPVHYLGADVPTDILVESVIMREPDVILLSVMLEKHRPAALRAIDTVTASGSRAGIMVGGEGSGPSTSPRQHPHVRMLGPQPLHEAVDTILDLRSTR